VREHGRPAFHNERQDGPSTRPKQLRNREVPWEGSLRSKLMSRRTERPYQVDGTDRLAPHSEVRCSVPEINGPVVQQKFTSLLRETCSPSPPAMAGATVSNDPRAGAGVSRGHSTGRHEPGARDWPVKTKKPERLTTREGLNLAGRHDRRWSCPGAMRPTGRATGSDHRGRDRVLRHSARTARNRRPRTRMSGGVGAGRGNSPGDPMCA
jgi:hypothetical protein